MKIAVYLMFVLCFGITVTSAWAVPKGMTVEFTKSPMGKVVFSGDIHAGKGLACDKCHVKVFQMKKGTAKIKLTDHQEGKFCFSCHNGKTAFTSKDNCNKCHVKATK